MRNARLSITILAASLITFSLSAHASTNELTSGIAVAAGQWIAAQGNAAVQEIEKELKEQLRRSLQPLLPMPAPGAAPRTTADAPAKTY